MYSSRHVFFTIGLVAVAIAFLFTSAPASATFAGKNGRIAFVADLSGTFQLYTINSDGSDLLQVTNLPPTGDSTWFPDYSPDGQQIVFSHDMTGSLELYVINADGTGLRQLTKIDGTDKLFPRWSPDGLRVVFSRNEGPVFEAISLMASDGSGDVEDATRSPWEVYQPAFTPDGRHILFGSQEGGLVSAIWIMNLHGSNKTRLTAAPIEAGGPDVSPDGRHVVFYSQQNTPRPTHAWVMNINGKGATQLVPNELVSLLPTYSPDGTKIAFQGGDSSESANVFTMNADGSDIMKIASDLVAPENCIIGNCLMADWGSDPVK